jgi:hypothetical protein
LAVVLLLCTAQTALAAGFINLKWDDCNGAVNKTFNCATTPTSPNHMMIASFDPGAAYADVIADLGAIDLIATSLSATVLPDYWQMQGGGCRGSADLLFSADFTSGPFTCTDMWGGVGATGGQLGGKDTAVPYLNTARIKWSTSCLPDAATAPDITGGTEYYVERISVKRVNTSCMAGCTDEVCLVFNHYELALLAGGTPPTWESDAGSPGTATYVTWQSAGVFNCPVATPTHHRTWGDIKSLYR